MEAIEKKAKLKKLNKRWKRRLVLLGYMYQESMIDKYKYHRKQVKINNWYITQKDNLNK